MAKTNLEYLKETLNDEQMEWLEGVVSDHKSEVDGIEGDVFNLEERVIELEKELQESIHPEDLCAIDFGIGKLEYLQPDNLRIQNFMDTLKERFHGHTLD